MAAAAAAAAAGGWPEQAGRSVGASLVPAT